MICDRHSKDFSFSTIFSRRLLRPQFRSLAQISKLRSKRVQQSFRFFFSRASDFFSRPIFASQSGPGALLFRISNRSSLQGCQSWNSSLVILQTRLTVSSYVREGKPSPRNKESFFKILEALATDIRIWLAQESLGWNWSRDRLVQLWDRINTTLRFHDIGVGNDWSSHGHFAYTTEALPRHIKQTKIERQMKKSRVKKSKLASC